MKIRGVILSLGAAVAAAMTTQSVAQFREITGPEPSLEATTDVESGGSVIEVSPGFARLVRFEKPISTIIVGNPEVARVTAQSDRSISIIPSSNSGTTNLIALGENGTEVFSGIIQVGGARSSLHRVEIVSKGRIHEWWTYFCSPTFCHRTKEELEGEPQPIPTKTDSTITIRRERGTGNAPVLLPAR